MAWGLGTVFIGIILSFPLFINFSGNIFICSLTIAFINDLFSSIWLICNLLRTKKIGKFIYIFKRKVVYFLILGSILGGPIGMAGYLLGVKYIGPSYTASFSAFYPAIGTVLSYVFLKEKIDFRMKIGVIISGVGILFLSYAPIDLEIYPHYILGIFFSSFCVIGWALECVIASYSMRYEDVEPEVAITLREVISTLFYGIVIIPIIKGYTLVNLIFMDKKILLLICLVALIGSLSYLFWYRAIDDIGASRGMALNITYVIWAIIFEKILIGNELNIKFIGASIIIILGVILISGKPKDIFNRWT